MTKSRSAIDTIKGYFYQFDYSIKQIITCKKATDTITIEGIEDIDIDNSTEETAIQCKYYSKTEYNHSVIAMPIRFMLSHFISEQKKGKTPIKYSIYGYYKGGHDKLSLPISVDFLKNNFLTYTKNKIKQCHHENIGASDADLCLFISHLEIDINAQEYSEQLNSVLDLLKTCFNCTDFEAEHFYYNNALNAIRELAIKDNLKDRLISKSEFLKRINYKSILFNRWFIEFKGLKSHFKELRTEYFTVLNSSSFDRFFLLEVNDLNYSRADLKELIFLISKKWSKISKRETNPFCPYIFIYGIDDTELVEVKRELDSEEFVFQDGFKFKGAEFSVSAILSKPDYNSGILLKFLNEQDHLDQVLSESRKTKEVYQFYYDQPFYNNESACFKHVKIQIQELKQIKEII